MVIGLSSASKAPAEDTFASLVNRKEMSLHEVQVNPLKFALN